MQAYPVPDIVSFDRQVEPALQVKPLAAQPVTHAPRWQTSPALQVAPLQEYVSATVWWQAQTLPESPWLVLSFQCSSTQMPGFPVLKHSLSQSAFFEHAVDPTETENVVSSFQIWNSELTVRRQSADALCVEHDCDTTGVAVGVPVAVGVDVIIGVAVWLGVAVARGPQTPFRQMVPPGHRLPHWPQFRSVVNDRHVPLQHDSPARHRLSHAPQFRVDVRSTHRVPHSTRPDSHLQRSRGRPVVGFGVRIHTPVQHWPSHMHW